MDFLRRLMGEAHRCSLAAAIVLIGATGAAAQQDDADGAQHRNQVTLEASWAGGSLGYARRTGPDELLGWEVGAAGWWLASEHFGGDHFDEGDLIGLAHVAPFWRREYSDRFELDVGFRLALVLHSVGSGDNAAIGLFAGPYVAPMFGWRDLKFGPRIYAGWALEGEDAQGLGIVVDPITARATLRF